MNTQNQAPLLSVKNLYLGIDSVKDSAKNNLVREISFDLRAGDCLAIVGESGCGKSLTAMSLAGLLPEGIVIQNGAIQFSQQNLHALSEPQWQTLRGNDIGVIFQNPLTAFNPTMRIGDQIAEVLVKHQSLSWPKARQQSIDLLQRMGVSSPAQRAKQYPFEFSGGMLQRAMIAMAVACKPRLLIADEPTTALDVTVQAQVLNLLRELQREQGMALLLVTHDLAVVAEMAQHVAVMYAGSFVEMGTAHDVLTQPQHPYTQALKSALPIFSETTSSIQSDYIPLTSLAGTPPDASQPIIGCALAPRCSQAMKICIKENPPWLGGEQTSSHRCWLAHDLLKQAI